MPEIAKRLFRWIGLCLVMAIACAAAPAATNAGLIGTCMVGTTPIAFGMYNPLRHADLPSVAMLHYRCVGSVRRLEIGLTPGTSGSLRTRTMRRGKEVLKYNLYLDAAGSQVWGDGTGGSQMYIVNSPASGNYVNIPVYGRVFGNQNDAAGGYHDDVSIIVRY
jgi:spore coat protein U-like protein